MPRFAALLLVFACAFASALLATGLASSPARAVGPSAPNQMALDADANAAGIQASRTVSDSALFDVAIYITQLGTTPYGFYQWEFEYPPTTIYFDGSVTHNTAGTGIVGCYNPATHPGAINAANTDVYGACGGGPTSTFTGVVETFHLACLTNGIFTISLLDASQDALGSTLGDQQGVLLDTGTTSMTINCTNGGTVVPTATQTPGGATPTATATRSPAPNVMSLDADSGTPGVQTSHTVFGTAPFAMDIWVTSLGQTPYAAYQWEVAFAPSELGFDDHVVEHASDTGMPNCQTINIVSGVLHAGDTDVQGSCDRLGANTHIFYTGRTTTFSLRCLALGAFTVTLVNLQQDPFFGSTLITYEAANIPTATESATITCAPPATPTATATPTTTSGPIRVGGVADVHVASSPPPAAADRAHRERDPVAVAVMLVAAILSLSIGWRVIRHRS